MNQNDKLINYLGKNSKAISLLMENGLIVQSISLLYVMLDHLGWLITEKEDSNHSDFKKWINCYCDLNVYGIECSAEDLWIARCGLLHMNTAFSRDLKKENVTQKYQLGYFYDLSHAEELKQELDLFTYSYPTKHIALKVLYEEVSKGIEKFLISYIQDQDLKRIVEKKVKLMIDIW